MSTRNDIITGLIDAVYTIKTSANYDVPLTTIEEFMVNYLDLDGSKYPLLMVIDQHNDEISVQDATDRRCLLDVNFHYVTKNPTWEACRENMNQFLADLREWLDSSPSINNVLDLQWIQSIGQNVAPGSAAQTYMGEVANVIRVVYYETRVTSQAAGTDTYGQAYIETAIDKIVTLIEALKTSIAADDPAIASVHSYHGVANLVLNGVTVDLDGELNNIPEEEGATNSSVSEFYRIPISVRVHNSYIGGLRDTEEVIRLVTGINNKLRANYELGDQYRIEEVEAVTSPEVFEDIGTIGGEVRLIVTVPVNHTQE